MAQNDLLIVEQMFQLQGIGLIVVPDFSIPEAGWENGTHQVRVVKPNGEQLEAVADFRVCYFNIRDPSAPLDERWRVVISFPALTKDDLPAGSRILGDLAMAATLL